MSGFTNFERAGVVTTTVGLAADIVTLTTAWQMRSQHRAGAEIDFPSPLGFVVIVYLVVAISFFALRYFDRPPDPSFPNRQNNQHGAVFTVALLAGAPLFLMYSLAVGKAISRVAALHEKLDPDLVFTQNFASALIGGLVAIVISIAAVFGCCIAARAIYEALQ
jgi:hypothetical protein